VAGHTEITAMKKITAVMLSVLLVLVLVPGLSGCSGSAFRAISTEVPSTEVIPGLVGYAAVGDSESLAKEHFGKDLVKKGNTLEYSSGKFLLSFSVKDGNIATITYTFTPDAETKRIVKEMAKLCGNSVEEIRAFCQQIKYNNAYSGTDPVLYGFTNWSGNCFVHAMCYQALLQYKGYEAQLVHCVDFTHYWNLVHTSRGGQTAWWHTDATPGPLHGPTPTLASDAERYETLQNGYTYGTRDWDRDKWPANPY